jgi:Flp pilus assembly protein TadB
MQTIHPNTGTRQHAPRILTQACRVLLRKLWLPRGVYESVPYVYLCCGSLALVSAVFSSGWTWILPYVVLLGLVCLHAGLALLTLRYRFRRRKLPPARWPRDPRDGH